MTNIPFNGSVKHSTRTIFIEDKPFGDTLGVVKPLEQVINHSNTENDSIFNPKATHTLFINSQDLLQETDVFQILTRKGFILNDVKPIEYKAAQSYRHIRGENVFVGYNYTLSFKVPGYISQYDRGAWVQETYHIDSKGYLDAKKTGISAYFDKYDETITGENTRIIIYSQQIEKIYALEELKSIISIPEGAEILDYKGSLPGPAIPDLRRYTIYLKRPNIVFL